jgi:hypothetical protein
MTVDGRACCATLVLRRKMQPRPHSEAMADAPN